MNQWYWLKVNPKEWWTSFYPLFLKVALYFLVYYILKTIWWGWWQIKDCINAYLKDKSAQWSWKWAGFVVHHILHSGITLTSTKYNHHFRDGKIVTLGR